MSDKNHSAPIRKRYSLRRKKNVTESTPDSPSKEELQADSSLDSPTKEELQALVAQLTTEKATREKLSPVTDHFSNFNGVRLTVNTDKVRKGGRDDTIYFAPSKVVPASFSSMFINDHKKSKLEICELTEADAREIRAKIFGKTRNTRATYDIAINEADIGQRAIAVVRGCNEEIIVPNVVEPGQELVALLEQRAGTTVGSKRSSTNEVKTTAGLRPDVLHVQFPGVNLDPVYRMVGEHKLILELCDRIKKVKKSKKSKKNKKSKKSEKDTKVEVPKRERLVPVDVAVVYDEEEEVAVRCAVNQIYSYMVVLELRYAYLCTYNTWWFMKRNRDTEVLTRDDGTQYTVETGKETLYISEAISVDSDGKGAGGASGDVRHSLCEAYCYFALTAINDESAVGYTGASEIMECVVNTYPGFPNNARLREDKAKLQESVQKLRDERPAGTGVETPGASTTADLHALVALIDKLPLAELRREPDYSEEVARGRAGTVYKGRVEGVPFEAMIKITDLIRTPELKDEMNLEYQCYCQMIPLWGTVVPLCIWAGTMPNLRVALVTSVAGEMGLGTWVVQKENDVNYDTVAKNLTEGLAQIHARGVAHGDVTARNIMIDDDGLGRVMFVDFGCATLLKPDGSNSAEFEAVKKEDLECMKNVLRMVREHTKDEIEPQPSNNCTRKRMSLRIA